jgi:SAM-dependent methyltransferase
VTRSSTEPPELALVIPTFNEEARLPHALEELTRFSQATGLAIHIIVADDGSSDSTRDIVRSWMEVDDRISLVAIDHRGKGAAIRAGMGSADAPMVGYCDADLSAGPDAIEKVYRRVKDGSDMAMGSRGLPQSVLEIRQPWYRERAGKFFNFVLRKLSGIPYRDTQCGLKIFRLEAGKEVFRHQRLDGFAFDAEVVVLARRLGFSVEEVPIRWAHSEGSKLSMLSDSFRMARDIVRIVRRLGRGSLHAPGVPRADAMELMVTSEERHWWHVSKRLLVRQTLEDAEWKAPCLDVGCGGGAMLAQTIRQMPAFGVDLSSHALQHARSRGLSSLVSAEGGALPFAEASFGTALALDVLEHHPNPEQMLGEIRRVLKPRGLLIVTVPAFQWMWSGSDYLLGHYRRYTKVQLLTDLRRVGFTVERATYFHSWLLPIAWVFRRLKGLAGRSTTTDDFPLPDALNRFFLAISRVELARLRARDLPFGLSILAIARRPGQ